MSVATLKRAGIFVAFVLAQVIVLGRIQLFHCATPLLYVYFIIQLPRNYPKWATLLWGFAMGLTIDTFTNTPGVAAATMTLLAAIKPYYLELFVPRDAAEDLKPTMKAIGPLKYYYYSAPLVLLYCLVFYTLEMFTFFNLPHWLLCIAGSAVLTQLLIVTFEIAKDK